MATFKLANQSFVFLMVGAFSVSILMFISPGYAEGFDDSDELLGNDDSKDVHGWMRKIEEVMEDNKRMKDDMEAIKNQISEMDSMRNQISEDKQLIMNMKQLIDDNRFEINDINEKPRFAAEIRSFGYLPQGHITGYNELIDVGNNFNPSTGYFTVGDKEEDEGTYVFLFSGRKDGDYGKDGWIDVYKNGNFVQRNQESDASHDLQMNDIMSFNLKVRDQINLENRYDDSIYVASYLPFTFTGYKV